MRTPGEESIIQMAVWWRMKPCLSDYPCLLPKHFIMLSLLIDFKVE
uniref:Uncharacterized protein n=1 Tax=Arundo donax TaxID=35708 RepID=A0A0A8YZ66_ARUDO